MNDAVPSPTAAGWDCHVHVFDGRPVAAASHYQPPARDLATLLAAGRSMGIGHVVLVQPSVYGTDNGLLLDTLAASGGAHRGVAVVEPSVSDAELDRMTRLGVRGIRFNLVSPVGGGDAAFTALAPRIATRGWHVQWYFAPAMLDVVADLHARHRVVPVLDHLAGLTPEAATNERAWRALARLAAQGGWIKLSGWYRLGAVLPYDTLDRVVDRIAGLFGPRCVWGSDWPHTRFLETDCREPPPPYDATWAPVARVLDRSRAHAVLHRQPALLYR